MELADIFATGCGRPILPIPRVQCPRGHCSEVINELLYKLLVMDYKMTQSKLKLSPLFESLELQSGALRYHFHFRFVSKQLESRNAMHYIDRFQHNKTHSIFCCNLICHYMDCNHLVPRLSTEPPSSLFNLKSVHT